MSQGYMDRYQDLENVNMKRFKMSIQIFGYYKREVLSGGIYMSVVEINGLTKDYGNDKGIFDVSFKNRKR